MKAPSSFVSIADVARRAGVSVATVSRVMNSVSKKASPETAEKVFKAIKALGYRPMAAGRTLRQGESPMVGVLAANLTNPSMAAMAATTESALRNAGYGMVLCDTHDQGALQDEHLLELRAQRVRSIVLLAAVRSRVLKDFCACGEPMVFVNRRNPFGAGNFVGIDNLAGGSDVARFFVARGYRHMAVIHGPRWSSATSARVKGFSDALRATAGIRLAQAMVATAPDAEHLQIGYLCAQRLLQKTPDAPIPQALFCTSDLIAYGAYRRAREIGLRIPQALCIVGFDDSPMNSWIAPWLSAVRVPYAQYGEAIAACIAQRRTSGEVILPHELIIRGAP